MDIHRPIDQVFLYECVLYMSVLYRFVRCCGFLAAVAAAAKHHHIESQSGSIVIGCKVYSFVNNKCGRIRIQSEPGLLQLLINIAVEKEFCTVHESLAAVAVAAAAAAPGFGGSSRWVTGVCVHLLLVKISVHQLLLLLLLPLLLLPPLLL